jgi:acetyl-CoA acyltransferase
MKNVVIVEGKRTAVARANKGALRDTRPDTFASLLLKNMLSRIKLNLQDVGDMIVGCAMPEGAQGLNIARTISMMSSLPESVPSYTINRYCSSGLQAINNIAQAIEVGNIELGIAGGVESMSMVPMGGFRFSSNENLVKDNIEFYTNMGITAENVASKFNISREQQDNFAFNSHRKSCNAIKNNFLESEIETIKVFNYNGQEKNFFDFSVDDGPRSDTTLEKLSKLRPCFKADGTVTAGNSSQMSDGAAFTIMSSLEYAENNNLEVLGYFRDFSVTGLSPSIMGIGPVSAIRRLLSRANLTIEDIGLFEINEAFASQSLYCIEELKINPDIVNINGGAIAQGHPLGCTGARQSVSILHSMKRLGVKYGVVSMCVGGGMGVAALFESK